MQGLQEQVRLLRDIRVALQNDDYPAAIESLEQIVVLAKEREDLGAAARHLGNLALTYYRSGQPEKALTTFNDALTCARADNDRLTENGLLGNMGNILREMGQHEQAIHYLNEALLISQEVGDKRGRGIWLSNLGLVYDDLQQAHHAYEMHEQAAAIARQLYDQPNLALRLGHMGNSLVAMGQFQQALPHFEEAAELYDQLGRRQEMALRLGIIGNLYAHIGRLASTAEEAIPSFKQALDYYERTLIIAREMEDPVSEAELLRGIGRVLADAGQQQHAISYLEHSMALFEQLSQPQKAAQVKVMLARIRK